MLKVSRTNKFRSNLIQARPVSWFEVKAVSTGNHLPVLEAQTGFILYS
jgi:hypothetical protein